MRALHRLRIRMKARALIQWVVVVMAICLGGCAGTVRDTSHTFTRVVIDAGHGGHDNGATSRYAGQEKDLALDVAMRLQPKLRAAGFETVLTRSNDQFIALDQRARISNRQENAIFVSVHFNCAPQSHARGSEVYYKSRVSAPIARNILNQILAISGTTSRGVKTANFRVLKRATFPAVLVECGFVSNPYEGRRCASGAFRESVAQAIARGIVIQRYGGLQMVAQTTPAVPGG
jgi:N-acetylmuramoyl-L-alanine amidase